MNRILSAAGNAGFVLFCQGKAGDFSKVPTKKNKKVKKQRKKNKEKKNKEKKKQIPPPGGICFLPLTAGIISIDINSADSTYYYHLRCCTALPALHLV